MTPLNPTQHNPHPTPSDRRVTSRRVTVRLNARHRLEAADTGNSPRGIPPPDRSGPAAHTLPAHTQHTQQFRRHLQSPAGLRQQCRALGLRQESLPARRRADYTRAPPRAHPAPTPPRSLHAQTRRPVPIAGGPSRSRVSGPAPSSACAGPPQAHRRAPSGLPPGSHPARDCRRIAPPRTHARVPPVPRQTALPAGASAPASPVLLRDAPRPAAAPHRQSFQDERTKRGTRVWFAPTHPGLGPLRTSRAWSRPARPGASSQLDQDRRDTAQGSMRTWTRDPPAAPPTAAPAADTPPSRDACLLTLLVAPRSPSTVPPVRPVPAPPVR